MPTRLTLLLSLGLFLFAAPVLAQEGPAWYVGGTIGRVDARFRPDYTFVLDGEPQQFDNRAGGVSTDLFIGRRHRLTERFSLGWQATAVTTGVKWSLSIPEEPADLQYWLPWVALASAIPDLHHVEAVSVFGDFGAGIGSARELKMSVSSSAYDQNRQRTVLGAGVGVRVRTSLGVDVFAEQRWLRYAAFEYDTFNPAGTRIEHVRDAPRARSFSIGVRMMY